MSSTPSVVEIATLPAPISITNVHANTEVPNRHYFINTLEPSDLDDITDADLLFELEGKAAFAAGDVEDVWRRFSAIYITALDAKQSDAEESNIKADTAAVAVAQSELVKDSDNAETATEAVEDDANSSPNMYNTEQMTNPPRQMSKAIGDGNHSRPRVSQIPFPRPQAKSSLINELSIARLQHLHLRGSPNNHSNKQHQKSAQKQLQSPQAGRTSRGNSQIPSPKPKKCFKYQQQYQRGDIHPQPLRIPAADSSRSITPRTLVNPSSPIHCYTPPISSAPSPSAHSSPNLFTTTSLSAHHHPRATRNRPHSPPAVDSCTRLSSGLSAGRSVRRKPISQPDVRQPSYQQRKHYYPTQYSDNSNSGTSSLVSNRKSPRNHKQLCGYVSSSDRHISEMAPAPLTKEVTISHRNPDTNEVVARQSSRYAKDRNTLGKHSINVDMGSSQPSPPARLTPVPSRTQALRSRSNNRNKLHRNEVSRPQQHVTGFRNGKDQGLGHGSAQNNTAGHSSLARRVHTPVRCNDKGVTVPKPFSLSGEVRQKKTKAAIEEARRRAVGVDSRRVGFKGRPMPDFSRPFPPPATS